MTDTASQPPAAYVRRTMQGPEPAPPGQTGAIRWVRENLFSSWLNAALTVGSVLAVFWIAAHIFPWMWNGVWSASSLTECREIRDARGLDSAACWAVIAERWPQLLFGFYPNDAYWRPVLAFVLLCLAVAPVLYSSLPRKLLWFSAAYPLVGYLLLVGGPVWTPVVLAAGFAVGWFVWQAASRALGALAGLLAGLAAALVWWFLVMPALAPMLAGAVPVGLPAVSSNLFGGFLLAMIIGVTGIALSLPLGILLALGRKSNLPIIHISSVTFIEVIRGVPLIVWLFTAHLLLNLFLPPGTKIDAILRVIIMVTLFASAYMAEVIRGGLAALPRGQYEAADSLGLDYWKSMRLIILPQALKISIPGIVNTFIGLFKDTTLVVFIGLLDPVGLSNSIRATAEWNGIYWELFIFIGLLFFIFCYFMSRYSQYLERRLQTDHR
jgi:general L-amino acid transport system permease protein